MNIRKRAAVLCAALMMTTAVFNYPAGTISAEGEDECQWIKGDVNFDGTVDQDDASLIMAELLSLDISGESILKNYIKPSRYEDILKQNIYTPGDVDLSDSGQMFDLDDASMILKAVVEADLSGEDEITDEIWNKVTGTDYSLPGVLWMADVKQTDESYDFLGITDDTDIADITFKVKDDAPDGVYEIKYIPSLNKRVSCFTDENTNEYFPKIYNGKIGINTEVHPVEYGNSFSFISGNASVKQGDTFTVSYSMKNLPAEIAALNFYFAYDKDIFDIISIKRSSDIERFGDFIAYSGVDK